MKYPTTKYSITGLGSPADIVMTKKMMDEMCEATINTNHSQGNGSTGYGSTGQSGASTVTGNIGYGTLTYGITATAATAPVFISTGTFGSILADDEDGCEVKMQSDSPDLPEVVFNTFDENGNTVRMTVKPEANISSSDTMKMTMLMMAMMTSPESFNALAYVKKNGLAQHFTYTS